MGVKFKIGLVLLVVVGYGLWRPEAIPQPTLKSWAQAGRGWLEAQVPKDSSQLKAALGKAREQVLGAYSAIQKDQKIPGLPEEVVVNDYVDMLTDKVKALPAEQLREVKRSFCQDVIDEATGSAQGD